MIALTFFPASAQVQFQQKYQTGFNNLAVWVHQCSDGSYVLAERGDYGNNFIKTDTWGNVLWVKTLVTNGQIDYVEETYDHGFFLIGSSLISQKLYYNLMKTDANGNLIWSKLMRPGIPNHELVDTYNMGNGNGSVTIRARETDDHGFILGGETFDPVNFRRQLQLIKIDSIGQLEWTKDYNRNYKSSFYDLEIVRSHAEGDTMIGYIIAGDFIDTTMLYNRDALLTQVDLNGNVDWSFIYTDTVLTQVSAFDVSQTDDGGFIVTGQAAYMAMPPEMLCMKINAAGNVVWSSKFNYPSAVSNLGYSSIQVSDGGYLFGGSIRNLVNDHAVLIKTDVNGNMQWAQRPYNVVGSDAYCVIETDDRGFAFCGQIFLTGLDYVMYFVKTDSMGMTGCNDSTFILVQSPGNMQAFPITNVAPTSIIDSAGDVPIQGIMPSLNTICLTTGIRDDKPSTISFYPNPTTGKLKIKNEEFRIEIIQVFNLYGEKVLEAAVSNEIDLTDQPPGIYFARIVIDGVLTSTRKFTVSK